MENQKVLGVISVSKAEKLLLDWANLPAWGYPPTVDDAAMRDASVKRMLSRHGEVFASMPKKNVDLVLTEVRRLLQSAWETPDVRARDWDIFIARYRYGLQHNEDDFFDHFMPPVPPVTPFEAAMFYLHRNAHRMQRCPNPSCPAPYFLKAPGKKVQKFCTPECAHPSRKESKRRWWEENRAKNAR